MKRRTVERNSNRPIFEFYKLEDRVLLSGEAMEAEGPVDPDVALLESMIESVHADGEMRDAEPVITNERRLEIVIVDSNVEDRDALLQGLRDGADDDTEWLVFELDADRDGIEQITESLDGLSGVDAIHLVSHGDGSGIQLGNTELDGASIQGYAGELAGWRGAMDQGADLLIYGCDLASTTEGQELIESLAALCDCDVAASDDLTGHDSLGGDWILEYRIGEIGTEVAFGYAAQASWYGTLDITTGLVGHYEFDSSGPVTDSTGNQDASVSTGNATGETPAAVGDQAVGFAVDAGGNNSYLEVADNAAQDFGIGDFTIAFWYNQNGNPSSDATILGDYSGAGTGFAVRATTGDALEFEVHGVSGSASSSLAATFDGTWQHVAITYDSNEEEFRWHFNGTATTATAFEGGNIDTSNPFRMGAVDTSLGDFDGQLDDVRLYTRELTSSDIAELVSLG
ncbi:MAG: DUF4347 domain-containing protein, partial [Planctomycetota bacterium]